MPTSWINIIIFLAAVQGFFLTTLIFHKHRRLYANRFLGLMMLFYSLILLNLFLMEINFYLKVHFPFVILLGIPLLVSPLHFLYAKYIIHPEWKFTRKDWLHFLPYILYQCSIFIEYALVGTPHFVPKESIESIEYPLEFTIFNGIITIQALTYFILTIIIVHRYSKKLKNAFSSIEKIKLTWLRNITSLALGVLCFFIFENIFMLAGINLSNYFNFSSVLFAIAIYVMGYMGLFRSEIFGAPEISRQMSQLNEMQKYELPSAAQDEPPQKYEKSGLTPEKAKTYLQQLQQTMQAEKLYRNSNLTLAELADNLSISQHNLSEVLNTRMQQNFFDFVNQYRVEEAKQALVDPAKQHLKILAIAFEVGFNSKTSFNTTFKKHTRQTPSEFRRQAKEPFSH